MGVDINPLAVLAAAVAAFVVSGVWYGVLGGRLAAASPAATAADRGMAWTVPVELGRGLVVAAGLAVLVSWARLEGIGQPLVLALLLWLAFPVVLLVGSVVHEGVAGAAAAIHAGDWLVKLLVLATVLGAWR